MRDGLNEHPLNAKNREAVRRANLIYAETGSMALAIKEAVKTAHEQVRTKRSDDDPLFLRDVDNILYCAGQLTKRLA